MDTVKNRPSTRQLLVKIPNFPCLYRHSVNENYYAIKKWAGKRKEHSLETTDRKIAERKLKTWIADLSKIDTEAEKTTLAQLLDKFASTRNGMSDSTKSTERGMIKKLWTNIVKPFNTKKIGVGMAVVKPYDEANELPGVKYCLKREFDQYGRDRERHDFLSKPLIKLIEVNNLNDDSVFISEEKDDIWI